MPVYRFICEKHGGFAEITIQAEWDDVRCPKCGAKSKADNAFKFEHEIWVKKYLKQAPENLP